MPALRERRRRRRRAARRHARRGDVALYHVGNDPEVHGWIVERLRARPGVVVLHDFVLHHLVAGLTLGRKDGARLPRRDGARRRLAARLLGLGVIDGCMPPLWEVRPQDFPLCGEVLDLATGVIVHSRYVEERVRERGYDGPVWRVPMAGVAVAGGRVAEVEGAPLFGAFGHMNASKRVPQLLRAFARFRATHPDARLVLVGLGAIRRSSSSGGSSTPGSRTRSCARTTSRRSGCGRCCARVDASSSLRAPTMGETSAIVIRALSLGKPLVVSPTSAGSRSFPTTSR